LHRITLLVVANQIFDELTRNALIKVGVKQDLFENDNKIRRFKSEIVLPHFGVEYDLDDDGDDFVLVKSERSLSIITSNSTNLITNSTTIEEDQNIPLRKSAPIPKITLNKETPLWVPDSSCNNCFLCNRAFSIVVRKHHW
jgi:hypothetical protein